MSTGAIFIIIANDGKQDNMLMATALLQKRLEQIIQYRVASGLDPVPTLLDIERTHILFVNAHFKPFAAMGFEYSSAKVQAGSAQLGGESTFSIPQYGDFFADMALHVILSAGTFSYTSSAYSSFDQEFAQNFTPCIQYCDYPGERLCSLYTFAVNGTNLDQYDTNSMVFWRERRLPVNKIAGYNTLVGQDNGTDVEARYVNANVCSGNVQYTGSFSGGLQPAVSAPRAAASQRLKMYTGAQTPLIPPSTLVPIADAAATAATTFFSSSVTIPALEMFIPLQFWFNMDLRLAIPSVSIPYGQRFLTMTINTVDKLLYRRLRMPDGMTAAAASGYSVGLGTISVLPTITTFELLINNLFVNPEIHDIFIKRVGFTLIRVHRIQSFQTTNSGSNENLLSNFKWPIELMYIGARPKLIESAGDITTSANVVLTSSNLTTAFPNPTSQPWELAGTTAVPARTCWWKFQNFGIQQYVTAENVLSVALANGTNALSSPSSFYTTAASTTASIATLGLVMADATSLEATPVTSVAAQPTPIPGGSNPGTFGGSLVPLTNYAYGAVPSSLILQISVKAHGVSLYQLYNVQFYQAYLPFTFGNLNVNATADAGHVMVMFAAYPGTYQPSGHINVSRAREFYLIANLSTLVNSTNQCTLYVEAQAENFLLVSDGSAVLRYTT